jgi:hypothetical protein
MKIPFTLGGLNRLVKIGPKWVMFSPPSRPRKNGFLWGTQMSYDKTHWPCISKMWMCYVKSPEETVSSGDSNELWQKTLTLNRLGKIGPKCDKQDTVEKQDTVKDIVLSVAIHFDLLKVEKSMKVLTDLIQGYVSATFKVSWTHVLMYLAPPHPRSPFSISFSTLRIGRHSGPWASRLRSRPR